MKPLMDPLGQVYKGKPGQGLATVLPESSFDPIQHVKEAAEKVEKDLKNLEEQKKEAVKRNQEMFDVKLRGWDIDAQRELIGEKKKFRENMLKYLAQGIDPTDPMNVEAYSDSQNQQEHLETIFDQSVRQKEAYVEALEKYQKDLTGKQQLDPSTKDQLAKYRQASREERDKILDEGLLINKPEDTDWVSRAKTIAEGVNAQPYGRSYRNENGTIVFEKGSAASNSDLEFLAEEDYLASDELQAAYPGPEGLNRWKRLVKAQKKAGKSIDYEFDRSGSKSGSGNKYETVSARNELVYKIQNNEESAFKQLIGGKIDGMNVVQVDYDDGTGADPIIEGIQTQSPRALNALKGGKLNGKVVNFAEYDNDWVSGGVEVTFQDGSKKRIDLGEENNGGYDELQEILGGGGGGKIVLYLDDGKKKSAAQQGQNYTKKKVIELSEKNNGGYLELNTILNTVKGLDKVSETDLQNFNQTDSKKTKGGFKKLTPEQLELLNGGQ